MFESKKNNIYFKLWAWLSTIGNLVVIWEWKETLIEDFTDAEPTKSFKWTIVKYKKWVPYQTEVVNAISKNGKNLIIQRAVELCPMNWTSTELVQNPYLFDEGDIFFMNLTAWDLSKIDLKFNTKLDIDWWIRIWLPINSIIYVNAEGEEDLLEFNPELDSWKTILIDPLWWLKLESPSVNIGILEEKTIINENDEFILNRPEEGNKKIGAINLLRANKEVFVAWENITQSDIDNWFNSLGFITNYSSPIKQETWATYYNIWTSTSATAQWQSFTITEPTTIQTIVLKMSKVNAPSGNLSIDIYSNTWTILIWSSTNTIAESSLSAFSTFWLQTFNFNNLVLVPGVYYLKVKTDRANNTSNYSIVQASNTNPYSGWANYEISNTNVWTLISGSDLYFSIWLTTNYSIDKLYKTDATNINKANPICFWVTPANIDENIIADTSWITPYTVSSWDIWKPFYLSNTPWAISTTPWTNWIKVGKGTTNWILLDLNSNNIWNVVGRAFWTNYLAPSDWFVVWFVYTNWAANVASCYTWVSSPAGTLITKWWSSSVSMYWYFMFPVKKWQYWRVDVSNWTITESLVSFIPNS